MSSFAIKYPFFILMLCLGIVVVGVTTGLRPGELLALHWDDVTLIGTEPRVSDGLREVGFGDVVASVRPAEHAADAMSNAATVRSSGAPSRVIPSGHSRRVQSLGISTVMERKISPLFMRGPVPPGALPT